MFKQWTLSILLLATMIISGCGESEKAPVCGNGMVEEGEICDGGSKSCVEIDSSIFSGGNANCRQDCSGWETSTCEAETIVCKGNYKIRTKSELDEIMLCREITGDLSIVMNDTKDVYLPFLEKTGGSVTLSEGVYDEEQKKWIPLYDDFIVEKLILPELKEIGGGFASRHNIATKSIEMPRIEKVAKVFSFDNNSNLELLYFPALQKIGISLGVHSCPKLKSLNFPELKEVYTGGIEPFGNFGIRNNALLEEIYFPKLEKVGRVFDIDGNNSLKSFEFPLLSLIDMSLFIRENENLEEFKFQKLDGVSVDLKIEYNEKLRYFEISGDLVVGEEFIVFANPSLETFTLDGFKRVGWGLEIAANGSLKSFSLPVFESSGALFMIRQNPSLTFFEAPNVKNLPGGAGVYSNNSLTYFELPNLKTAGILIVGANKLLASFAMPNLEKVGAGGISIGNENHQSHIDNQGNSSIESFDLSALSRVDGEFQIMNNLELPTATAIELRDQVLERDGIGGETTICYNKDSENSCVE